MKEAEFIQGSMRGYLSRNVPTPSAIFTGREAELRELHTALQPDNTLLTPVLYALVGREGVGTTQTAAQYAHLFRESYAGVFWVSGESPKGWQAQIAGLAPELVPPISAQPDMHTTFQAVQAWFATHGGWLLIVDNVENQLAIKTQLPYHPRGRVLVTTRPFAPSHVDVSIRINHMDEVTGATLLLRAAGILAPNAPLDTVDVETQAGAKRVCADMQGFPLALDQAGAYMRSEPLAPDAYQLRCRERSRKLHPDYSEAPFLVWAGIPTADGLYIEATTSLTMERLLQTPDIGEATAQLAYLCAFLALDAIPDAVFLTAPEVLPAALTPLVRNTTDFREAWQALCDAALLRRQDDPAALSMHALTQRALRNSLSDALRKVMAEQATQIVNAAFPEPGFPMWPFCERLLPHALVCIRHIKEYALRTLPAARLLNKTARYLQQCARHAEANPLFVLALTIEGQVRGEEHAGMAVALNNVGLLYRDRERYEDAAFFLEEAVAIDRRVLSEDDAKYMTHLDNLAGVYCKQSCFKEAVPLYEQALEITRRMLGSQHPSVIIRLSDLAIAYSRMERYGEAEILWQEALTLDRQTVGEDHPDYATHLVELAVVYIRLSRAADAEPLLTQALSIYTQAYGTQHLDVADCHCWQGEIRYGQGNLTAALAAFQQALEIRERLLGLQHQDNYWTRIWVRDIQRMLAEEEPSSVGGNTSPLQGEG